MGISRSRYYSWRKNPLSKRANADAFLTEKIKAVFVEGRENYGTRSIRSRLAQRGIEISRKRMACKEGEGAKKPSQHSGRTFEISCEMLDRRGSAKLKARHPTQLGFHQNLRETNPRVPARDFVAVATGSLA